ncbi:MAG TPA: alpha-2-macroglobulin family protein, partial [Marinilabiliaceae bacterium]|nr:alpha-2-macroglobulin family protein [Marinilabiliaceae bacterium]
YEQVAVVNIQDPAKKLNLSLSSFRDKTTPGSKEEWHLTLKDGDKKPVKAEILALMYDASLDAYASNSLFMNPFSNYKSSNNWISKGFGNIRGNGNNQIYIPYFNPADYPSFFWTGQSYYYFGRGYPLMIIKSARTESIQFGEESTPTLTGSLTTIKDEDSEDLFSQKEEISPTPTLTSDTPIFEVRKNLQETAFFFPFLQSDSLGEVSFKFTMPESLTRWRFMALAHRKDGQSANTEEMITTSKQLMVVPNLPRVVRHGDELVFNTTIVNNSENSLSGSAYLTIKDVVTEKEIPLNQPKWEADAGKSANAQWKVTIPNDANLLEITIGAKSDNLSDGETHFIPVLSSKTLVTKTLPITLNNKGKYAFEMKELTSGKKGQFEQFTFTYTANAAWEMLDALPWVAERPYDNNDQIFNRYFAASMAQHIFKQHPNIKKVLTAWAALPNNEDALTSALERNPELKSTLLTATPWLTQANNDSERLRRLAELVDETNINTLLSTAITQLKNNQLEDGSWPWFSGIYSSPHTTMEIITGFGYLHKTGAAITEEDNSVVNRAIEWLHNYLDKEEANLKESKRDTIQGISNEMIKGLYALSFFEGETQRHSFWMSRLEKNLPVDNIQLQSMVATILHRSDNSNQTAQIMQSLEEKLVDGENLTSFYKTTYSPYWYQSPLETHITALEVFREIDPYNPKVQRLENWLIAQKRTQSWETTRATIGAIYSLAQSKRVLFSTENNDVIKVGNNTLKPASEITGLGYFNQTWQKEQIQPKMGHVVIDKKSDTPSWASLHLQYFKDTKEIEEGGFLKTSNLFFKRVISNGTERWEKIEESTKLTKGDRILIQIEVESPQTLDFVHLKSPRASALEPADHLSGYQWNQGVGFYQSITDAGVDFFIDHLPKGRITLQYETIVSMEGNVVNGPSEVSCFYAPEFAGHGSAQTLHIKEE